MPETIAIASDHAGFDLKQFLVEELRRLGFAPLDLGTHDRSSVDYPDFADGWPKRSPTGAPSAACWSAAPASASRIAANRHRHVRAAVSPRRDQRAAVRGGTTTPTCWRSARG